MQDPNIVALLSEKVPSALANVILEFAFQKPRTEVLLAAEWKVVQISITKLLINAHEGQGCPPMNFYLPVQTDFYRDDRDYLVISFKKFKQKARRLFKIARLREKELDGATIVNHCWCCQFIDASLPGMLGPPNPFQLLRFVRKQHKRHRLKSSLRTYGFDDFEKTYSHINRRRAIQIVPMLYTSIFGTPWHIDYSV